MQIHRDIIQGTEEWHDLRKGKMTGSKASAIASQGKGLETYVKQIVIGMFAERKSFTNEAMERGHELEPIGRMAYELQNGVDVEEVGFITHNEFVGYSPDGLVGEDGLIEHKARNNEIHFDLLMNGKVDSSTIWQMQFGMLIAKRKWCDFVCYNPNFKQSLFVQRFYPDPEKQDKIKKGIFLGTKKLKELLENPIIKTEINE